MAAIHADKVNKQKFDTVFGGGVGTAVRILYIVTFTSITMRISVPSTSHLGPEEGLHRSMNTSDFIGPQRYSLQYLLNILYEATIGEESPQRYSLQYLLNILYDATIGGESPKRYSLQYLLNILYVATIGEESGYSLQYLLNILYVATIGEESSCTELGIKKVVSNPLYSMARSKTFCSWRKKRRYADPGASTSQMQEMVPRAEFDIVAEQLRKVMAFMHQHLGMTMDGESISQLHPPPPHDQQQPPQIDPANPPQQGDNVERGTQEWLTRDEHLELNSSNMTIEVPSSRIVIIECIYALSEELRPILDLRVSITGGVHFDLVKRVLRDIQRADQEPEEIIQQISKTHPQGVVGGGPGDGAGPMVVFSGLEVMENQLD
ncbi:hypothetical protein Syun_021322 [Stephania yunnanensis]|uniref:Uncharacterized protein n=1 Tax=Stephania yunnanensis TaxID=152371 RepID=A0AAP0IG68_9MAGN